MDQPDTRMPADVCRARGGGHHGGERPRGTSGCAGRPREPSTSAPVLAARAAAGVKAEDVKILDMHELVTYTDFLVVCTGRNVAPHQAHRRRGELQAEAGGGSAPGRQRGRRPAGSGSCSTTSTSWSTSSRPRRGTSTGSTCCGSRRRPRRSSDRARGRGARLRRPGRLRARPGDIMRDRLAVGV